MLIHWDSGVGVVLHKVLEMLFLGIAVGVVVLAVLAAVLPATIATAVVWTGAILGAATLGWGVGEAITGDQIYVENWTIKTRTLCDEERSKLWGESLVGVAGLAFSAAKIKNVIVDKPHGQMGPHFQYGPNYPGSGTPGHPQYHFGPMAPKGGSGSWEGWIDYFAAGPKNWKWRIK